MSNSEKANHKAGNTGHAVIFRNWSAQVLYSDCREINLIVSVNLNALIPSRYGT